MPDLRLIRQTLAQSPRVVLVSIAGQVNVANGLQAEQYFDKVLQEEKPRHVLLDLHGLTFAGSLFFSSLLFWREKLAAQGGQLVLFGLRPEINSTLRIMALDQVLTIRADQPSALAAVSESEER
jgi:anti-anti-sigma factor